MNLRKMECQCCGAKLQLPQNNKEIVCHFCGMTYVVEKNTVSVDEDDDINDIIKAANAGDIDAQMELVDIYGSCYSDDYDDNKCLFWTRKLAQEGEAYYQNELARMHEAGRGTLIDLDQAIHWYEQAIKQGYIDAMFNLGVLYHRDKNYSESYANYHNLDLAKKFFRMGAEHGDDECMYALGVCYKNEGDYSSAFKYFEQSANEGNTDSQTELGFMYMEGCTIEKNYAKAAQLFSKGVSTGNIEAHYYLGLLYEDGLGVGKDSRKAFQLFKEAANNGHALSEYHLGLMYLEGRGVSKSEFQGMMALRNSADHGCVQAILKYWVIRLLECSIGDVLKKTIRFLGELAQQNNELAIIDMRFIQDNHLDYSIYYDEDIDLNEKQRYLKDLSSKCLCQCLNKEGCPNYLKIKNFVDSGNIVEVNQYSFDYMCDCSLLIDALQSYYSSLGGGIALSQFKRVENKDNIIYLRLMGMYYLIWNRDEEKDYSKAIEYFNLAIEKGDDVAWLNVSFMYGNGLGVEQSLEKAKDLYAKYLRKIDS